MPNLMTSVTWKEMTACIRVRPFLPHWAAGRTGSLPKSSSILAVRMKKERYPGKSRSGRFEGNLSRYLEYRKSALAVELIKGIFSDEEIALLDLHTIISSPFKCRKSQESADYQDSAGYLIASGRHFLIVRMKLLNRFQEWQIMLKSEEACIEDCGKRLSWALLQ